jgi:mannose-6-phosphate isomerase-like protein (cupin superfamily)
MIAPLLAGNVLGSVKDSFAVAEWSDAGVQPGPPRLIAPWHVHHEDDEAWYVLEGALCVQKGTEVVEVPAGAGVLVPRGTVHSYWNSGPKPVRYLLFMTPTILGLIEAIHELKERTPAAVKAVFEAHASSLADEPTA